MVCHAGGHAAIRNAGRFGVAVGGTVCHPQRFFFFDVAPRYRFEDIDVLDFRVCYNGEWYNTRFVPPSLIETILHSPQVENEHKAQLQKMMARKGELSFYDVFTLTRAEASQ